MKKMMPLVGGCAFAVSLVSVNSARAQYSILNDVFQDSVGFNLGPSYVGPVVPGSFSDPYATTDYRGVARDGDYDAYDGAGAVLMDVAPFSPVRVDRRVDALQSLIVYRWIDTYTNITEEPTTVAVHFWTNLGSDGGEFVALQNPYRFVSFENKSGDEATPTDPVVAMMHGNNAWTAENITLLRFADGGGTAFSSDDILRAFTLSLAPGESKTLMFADFLAYTPTDFGEGLFGDPGLPSDVELTLARSATLIADPSDLFADLGRGVAETIVNWTVPSPGAVSVFAIGFVAVGRRRR